MNYLSSLCPGWVDRIESHVNVEGEDVQQEIRCPIVLVEYAVLPVLSLY